MKQPAVKIKTKKQVAKPGPEIEKDVKLRLLSFSGKLFGPIETLENNMRFWEDLGCEDPEDLHSLRRCLDKYVNSIKPAKHVLPSEVNPKSKIESIVRMVQNKMML